VPDHILRIPLSDRAEVLQSIAPRAGLPPHVLEKDIWVCWALAAVFEMLGRLPLAFKGGTALSKVYQAIGRFSEDIDLTIDYTALSGGADPLTQEMSGNAIKKLSEALRAAVGVHTREVIAPYLTRLGQERLGATLAIDVSEDGEGVRIRYPSAFGGDPSYLRDRDSVLLEFGGRNTTLPNELHRVVPYAAAYTESLEFPIAEVIVLSPHRTFWEKATLIHAECHRPERPAAGGAERLSRHWYDLARLAGQEIGTAALKDRELLGHVVRLKGIFYRSGFANYPACLDGKFRLIPDEPLRVALVRDYSAMVSEGMFFETPNSFATILEELRALETALNRA
jgi:hypothetical protein